MQTIEKANRMIHIRKLTTAGGRVRAIMLTLLGFAMQGAPGLSAHADSRAQPPWHIESFCHRGAAPARRCLVRARQGILVVQLAELPSTPAVSWNEGVAVLTFGADERSRQLRFYVPPQKLSAVFKQVRAYDTRQQLVAVYADGRVHLRGMFAEGPDIAVLNLPANIGKDTLQVLLEGRRLHASWRDSDGGAHEQTLPLTR